MEKTNFIPVDLHVHTPASKCYKGNTDESEYVNIVRNYFNKGIKVIAITDHNTIKGYKEICRIENDIDKKILTLQDYEAEIPAISDKIKELKEVKTLFNSMLILPGVELELNPGIHLLFIFDPDKDMMSQIENFIIDCGYTENVQGIEDPSNVIKYDVIEALRKAKELGAVTIAAHVDSNKGIYNDLRGSYRSRVFKSDDLDAISVNSTVNIDKISELLTQPEYKRNKPLAYIQSSDHHSMNECGRRITYVNMNSLSFSSLEKSFNYPTSNISPTARPEVRNIINQISQDRNTILSDTLDYDFVSKASCALLNNKFGYLLIGVTSDSHRNIKGIHKEDNMYERIIEHIMSSIVPDKIYYSINFVEYKWGDKVVLLLEFDNISNHSFAYGNVHYHIEGNVPIASTTDYLLSPTFKKELVLEEFNENHYNKLNSLSMELQIISEQRFALKVIDKIETDGVNLSSLFDIKVIDPTNEDYVGCELNFGYSEGNVYSVDSMSRIRGENYYVRCTGFRNNKLSFDDNYSYKGKAILMTPRGVTYLLPEENVSIYNYLGCHVVLLRLKEEFSFLSLHSVLAWLKSSAFLWYIETLFADSDIFKPALFTKIRIPASLLRANVAQKLENCILNIMEMERNFLVRQEEIMSNSTKVQEDREFWDNFAKEHNCQVDVLAKEIDDIINEQLGFDAETQNYLYRFLDFANYHILTDVN